MTPNNNNEENKCNNNKDNTDNDDDYEVISEIQYYNDENATQSID